MIIKRIIIAFTLFLANSYMAIAQNDGVFEACLLEDPIRNETHIFARTAENRFVHMMYDYINRDRSQSILDSRPQFRQEFRLVDTIGTGIVTELFATQHPNMDVYIYVLGDTIYKIYYEKTLDREFEYQYDLNNCQHRLFPPDE